MTILNLSDLVTPQGLPGFLAAFAGKTRWHLPLARAAQVQDLLPWATLEGLLAHSLVPVERFRVVVNGNELPAPMYSEEGRLRVDAVQGYAAQGATLVINDIGALLPAIGELSAAMERELRCRIGVNCYSTFGAKSAFIPHHDAHDVLVLQVHGAKHWVSHGSPVVAPLAGGRPPVTGAPLWEGLLTPGDLLFLPRGEVHAAVPQTRPSVHLTIGLTDATGVDFLEWLATRVKDLEPLRRDLGVTLEGEARALRQQGFKQALAQLLDSASVDEFFADRDRSRHLRPLATLGAGLRQPGEFPPAARWVSALRRRLDLATEREGEVALSLGTRQVRLAQGARRALAQITSHDRIATGELASHLGLDAGDPGLTACLQDLLDKSLVAIVA
jgi:hypothetical protein